MPYSDLVPYIKEQTQQGVSADALRQQLMAAGWPELDITNALHDVAAGLHPVGEGASIHEDLAQVRGVVAHLAARVRVLEAHLTSAPALLPMGAELPMSPPVPMLSAGRATRWRGILLVAVLAVLAGAVVWIIRHP